MISIAKPRSRTKHLKLASTNAAATRALSKTNIQSASKTLSTDTRQRCIAYTEDIVEGWLTLGILPSAWIHYEILFEGARLIAEAAAKGYPRAAWLVQQWREAVKHPNVDCTIREVFDVMGLPRH